MAEVAVLGYLEKNNEMLDSGEFAALNKFDHQQLINVIKSLHGSRLVDAQNIKRERWVLTEEGEAYAASNSPEVQIFFSIPPEGISLAELQEKLVPSVFNMKVFKAGCAAAQKSGWIRLGKQLTRTVESVHDVVKDHLLQVLVGKVPKEIEDLKKRKLVTLKTWKGYTVKKGPSYAPKRKQFATDFTRENLQRADWKDLEFKEYNSNADGQPIVGGHLNPLLKVLEQMKMTFLHMRFEEMPTNNYVESSFQNFDVLYQPQQHPARDSHDTFFLQAPSSTKTLPEDYVDRVKKVHMHGGYGSRGYESDWKREEAEKNLLRTHTTAVSSKMLYLLAQALNHFFGFLLPGTFCSQEILLYRVIDRVFRNETVDRTHLAEFHQIEGLICDRGLTLGDLIGVLYDFFTRIGMSKLKFKPAYNPYTEPSMEIFSYHEGLGKWVEIGNSGMFRPEVLGPMGFPDDVRVIAWGLSLERPTMILYGIDNIRDLFGHEVHLGLIKRNPICRLGIDWKS